MTRRNEFHSIALQAFKTYKSRQTFRFLEGDGLGFIKGTNLVTLSLESNATGKSTLLDAICWCLYGKTLRGLRGPSVVPWVGKGLRTEVSVVLSGVVIFRARDPNTLTLDAAVVDQGVIDNFIGLSYEEFKHSIVIGQFTTFFTELKATDRASLFTKVLCVDEWGDYSEVAKGRSKRLLEEIQDLDIESARLEARLEGIGVDADLLELDSIWKLDKKKKIQLYVKDMRSIKSEIREYNAELDTMARGAELILSKADRLKRNYEAISKYLIPLTTKQAALERAFSKIEGKKEIVLDQRENLKAVEGICYVCGQKVGRLHKRRELARLDVDLKKLDTRLLVLEDKQKVLKSEMIVVRNDIAVLADKIRSATIRVEDSVAAIEKMNSRKVYIIGDLKNIRIDYSELKNKESPYKSRVDASTKKKRAIKSKLYRVVRKLKVLRHKQAGVQYWIKGFKDIRSSLILETLLQLELEVNSVIERLGLPGWSMKFPPEDIANSKVSKGFNIQVITPHNKEPVAWESWCGGETSRLRLAAQLGLSNLILNRKGVDTNFQAFDEPTTWMAAKGVEDLVLTLKEWSSFNKRWVWLVDHRTLSYQFDSVVFIVRKRTGSKIIQKEHT